MVFTDDNLKKLKAYLENTEGRFMTDPGVVQIIFERSEIKALISRLEAVENYRNSHPCQDSGCLTDLLWRKAAGKSG